jgi:hypothetical protein
MKSSTLSIIALLSLTTLTTLGGCAAPTEDDASASADAVTETRSDIVATLTTNALDAVNDHCTSSGSEMQVSGLGADVDTAINAALSNNRTTTFADVDCSKDSFEWQSTMTTKLNAHGILSIEESGTSMLYGAAHDSKFVLGHNFDLATGKTIDIKDLLTAKGIANAIIACNTSLNRVAVQLGETDDYTPHCTEALTEQHGPASFTVEQAGLRVHPSLGSAAFALEANGALIPWTAVQRNLTKAGVKVRNASK